jgi:transcriptional regulator of acetoin/glycerol metabolism
VTPEAASLLVEHEWPLNIRELRHCLASALVIAAGEPLGADHVTPALNQAPRSIRTSDDLHAQLVAALKTHRGNVAAVARAFGKGPTQVHRWMKQLGLDVSAFRPEK